MVHVSVIGHCITTHCQYYCLERGVWSTARVVCWIVYWFFFSSFRLILPIFVGYSIGSHYYYFSCDQDVGVFHFRRVFLADRLLFLIEWIGNWKRLQTVSCFRWWLFRVSRNKIIWNQSVPIAYHKTQIEIGDAIVCYNYHLLLLLLLLLRRSKYNWTCLLGRLFSLSLSQIFEGATWVLSSL